MLLKIFLSNNVKGCLFALFIGAASSVLLVSILHSLIYWVRYSSLFFWFPLPRVFYICKRDFLPYDIRRHPYESSVFQYMIFWLRCSEMTLSCKLNRYNPRSTRACFFRSQKKDIEFELEWMCSFWPPDFFFIILLCVRWKVQCILYNVNVEAFSAAKSFVYPLLYFCKKNIFFCKNIDFYRKMY